MCILELNKVPMYEFHYGYTKNKYDNESRLLFTDIGSLMYETETGNVYEDFRENKKIFDFINYSAESKHYGDSNVLVVGKIKDKMGGVATEEFVGLKAKMYSILVSDTSE